MLSKFKPILVTHIHLLALYYGKIEWERETGMLTNRITPGMEILGSLERIQPDKFFCSGSSIPPMVARNYG